MVQGSKFQLEPGLKLAILPCFRFKCLKIRGVAFFHIIGPSSLLAKFGDPSLIKRGKNYIN